MKIQTQRRLIHTADTSTTHPQSSRISPSSLTQVQAQIKNKIDKFINWDPHAHAHIRSRRPERNIGRVQGVQIVKEENNIFSAIMQFLNKNKKKRKENVVQNHKKRQENTHSPIITDYQRQKYIKMPNPLQFISIFMQNNIFQPNEPQQMLIQKLMQVKKLLEMTETLHLQKVLEKMYQIINFIVDFNQLRLLVVIVVLTANICYQGRDFNRAFFFYHQSKIAGQLLGATEMIIQSLIGMARIGYDLGHSQASIKFLKKALAYAWQHNDKDSQTQIYDLIGQNYCLEGKMAQAAYYHERFVQNYFEKQTSAIRKIYLEIIKDDAKSRNLRLYSQNIDVLFLQTVDLPVFNFQKFPPHKIDKIFDNSINGESPRKDIINKNFDYDRFDDAQHQIKVMLKSPEFDKQMPNPDVQMPYTQSRRYGRPKRDIQFNKTVQFHEITHTKMQVKSSGAPKKYSLQKKIQMIMSQKPDPHWYEKMSANIKRQRLQKLGSLKDPVRQSHLKTQQRRRSLSTQSQNIRRSINKAILMWIDPPQ